MKLLERLSAAGNRVRRPMGALRRRRFSKDPLTRLADRFGTDKGSKAFAAHGYTRIYHEVFGPLRHQAVRLLELGLLRAGSKGWLADPWKHRGSAPARRAPSLSMWAAYFPHGEIFGLDINDFSAVRLERCSIFKGDAADPKVLEQLVDVSGGDFDFIIDDASHTSQDQQIALAALFPSLRAGGVYAIEDLTFRRLDWEAPNAMRTVDLLRRAEQGLGFHSPHIGPAQACYLEDHVERIEMYDSISPTGTLSERRDSLALIFKRS